MPSEIEEELKAITERRREFLDRGEGNNYDYAHQFADDIFWLLGYVAMLRDWERFPQGNSYWFEDEWGV